MRYKTVSKSVEQTWVSPSLWIPRAQEPPIRTALPWALGSSKVNRSQGSPFG